MKLIPLTRGYSAMVDDDDYDYLSPHRWVAIVDRRNVYAKRFVRVGGIRQSLAMHRVVMGLNNPKEQVDHRDHNGLNNQRSNLRLATGSQNRRNSRPNDGTICGLKGVTPNGSRWVAKIRIAGNRRTIGRYPTPQAAAMAYNKAALHAFGEFAYLNPIAEEERIREATCRS